VGPKDLASKMWEEGTMYIRTLIKLYVHSSSHYLHHSGAMLSALWMRPVDKRIGSHFLQEAGLALYRVKW